MSNYKTLAITIFSFVLITMLAIGTVSGLEGTEVWSEGGSITYEIEYNERSYNTDTNKLETDYDIQGAEAVLSYEGLTGGQMIFEDSTDNEKLAEAMYDDPDTSDLEKSARIEVDPETGEDDDGDFRYFFMDTTDFEDGHDIGHGLDLEMTSASISKTFEVAGDVGVITVDGTDVNVWDAVIDDFSTVDTFDDGTEVEYRFENMLVRLSDGNGVLMAQSFTISADIDLDSDGEFDTTIVSIAFAMNPVSISEEGLEYNAPFASYLLVGLSLVAIVAVRKKFNH